jgi:5-methylcytosine-specific restriction endonuclease McrA
VGEWAGTSWLDATADTVDLTKFGDVVADLARRLGEAGDTDTLEQRRAKAIGVVADVHAGADLDELIAALATPTGEQQPVRRSPRLRARELQRYVHLDADALEGGPAGVEHLGAVTVARVEEWLARHTAAGGRARVTPVVDLARDTAVDRHDPPPWMAEQVRLRDPRCVFPYCQTHARDCDLDHIVPYVPPDEGGPPGRTNPQNLTPLCRRHHRAKTARRWLYERTDDGSYAWTSRYEQRYLVKTGGTLEYAGH